VKYLADRRLEELGFEAGYNVPNPAKWMAAAKETCSSSTSSQSTNTSYGVNATQKSGSTAVGAGTH
jgi:ribonucleoside-diphosphate reductase beta chain